MIRALLLSASLLLSCGKEESAPKPAEQGLAGTWKLETIGTRSGPSKSAYDCPAGSSQCRKLQTYTFKAGGVLTEYVEVTTGQNVTRNHAYTTSDSDKKMSVVSSEDGKEFRYNVTLSGSSLKLDEYEVRSPGSTTASPSDQTITFSRQ